MGEACRPLTPTLHTLDHTLKFKMHVWLLKMCRKELYCESELRRVYKRDVDGLWYAQKGDNLSRIHHEELTKYLEKLCATARKKFGCYSCLQHVEECLAEDETKTSSGGRYKWLEMTPANWRSKAVSNEGESVLPYKVLVPSTGIWRYGLDQGRGFYCSRPTGIVYFRALPGEWCYVNETSNAVYGEVGVDSQMWKTLENVFQAAVRGRGDLLKKLESVDQPKEDLSQSVKPQTSEHTRAQDDCAKVGLPSKEVKKDATSANVHFKKQKCLKDFYLDLLCPLKVDDRELTTNITFKNVEVKTCMVLSIAGRSSEIPVFTCIASRKRKQDNLQRARNRFLKYNSLHFIFKLSDVNLVKDFLETVLYSSSDSNVGLNMYRPGTMVSSIVRALAYTKGRSSSSVSIVGECDWNKAKAVFTCRIVYVGGTPYFQYCHYIYRKRSVKSRVTQFDLNQLYSEGRKMMGVVNGCCNQVENPVIRILILT